MPIDLRSITAGGGCATKSSATFERYTQRPMVRILPFFSWMKLCSIPALVGGVPDKAPPLLVNRRLFYALRPPGKSGGFLCAGVRGG
jgi:hypothetical protein